METMTIGQLAKRANVNVETVRYYERRGLIARPTSNASGYRQYTPRDVARIEFIKRCQSLGFSLNEIADLLSLRVDPKATCADVKQRAEAKIADVEEKLEELARIKSALSRLAETCTGEGPSSECPILDALEGEKQL